MPEVPGSFDYCANAHLHNLIRAARPLCRLSVRVRHFCCSKPCASVALQRSHLSGSGYVGASRLLVEELIPAGIQAISVQTLSLDSQHRPLSLRTGDRVCRSPVAILHTGKRAQTQGGTRAGLDGAGCYRRDHPHFARGFQHVPWTLDNLGGIGSEAPPHPSGPAQ